MLPDSVRQWIGAFFLDEVQTGVVPTLPEQIAI
jgi:hypothetical protein